MKAALLGALLLPLAGAAMAQEPGVSAIPDPNTITVPEITGGRDDRVVRNGWKFFYFWRENTTYEQAYADFSDCYRFLPVPNIMPGTPAFVAWRRPDGAAIREPVYNPQYGIVGAIIGSMVAGPLERRASQSRMRRCMEPRGYQRFPATEEVWEQIIDSYSANSIAVKAKIASGPRPDADPLPEDR